MSKLNIMAENYSIRKSVVFIYRPVESGIFMVHLKHEHSGTGIPHWAERGQTGDFTLLVLARPWIV